MTIEAIVIAGGGIAGLATALATARQGRRVIILEHGGPPPEGLPDLAGAQWARLQVAGWRHAHSLTSLGVSVLRDRAPWVLTELEDAGGMPLDLVQAMPPHPQGRHDGDEELVAFACRRPTLELVLYRIVRTLPEVEIRHRARVCGLVLNAELDRVTGVFTGSGEKVPAGIVIDATGQRAEARAWLAAAGLKLKEDQTSPAELRIFTRFYEGCGPVATLNRGNAAGVLSDHYACVLHPGDNNTFSVSLGVLPEDRVMRPLSRPTAFSAAAHATPGVAEWLTRAMPVPISEVRSFTCRRNRLRALASTWPQPVAGLIPVGDAACVTNPLYGRGMSLAIAHAFAIGDLLATCPGAGPTQSHQAVKIARDLFTPWYQQATEDDAERIARWVATMNGTSPPGRPARLTTRTVAGVAGGDAVIWRGLIRVLMGLKPPAEVFEDGGFEDRVRRALAAGAWPRPVPGPTRTGLVAAVTAATGG